MSHNIKVVNEIDASVGTRYNLPIQLLYDIKAKNGIRIISTQEHKFKDEIIAPGAFVNVSRSDIPYLEGVVARELGAILIHPQTDIDSESSIVHKGPNDFNKILAAIKLISKNSDNEAFRAIASEGAFSKLEELVPYLVQCDIVDSGRTDIAISGPVADIEHYSSEEWYTTNAKIFGAGNQTFYVNMHAHLDDGFGRENLDVSSVTFSSEIYLRENLSLYKTEIEPLLHTVGKISHEMGLSSTFFEEHNFDKIITNDQGIKLRTFDSEGSVDSLLNQFVSNVRTIYEGLAGAISDIKADRVDYHRKIAKTYFSGLIPPKKR